MHRTARIFILAAGVLCVAPSAAMADDRGTCGSVPPKSDAVGACSRIIASPNTSAHDRALAYTFRANVKRAQGDLAGAVADYGEALTLLPDLVLALNGRGMSYRLMDNPSQAIADFDQAIKLDPKNPTALYQRGLAKGKRGDAAGGDADIAAAKALDPSVTNQH
jgi:tetratricopeptide (TPR) repeat protein